MTPEQIIEEYRAALVAALGEEVASKVRIEHWNRESLRASTYALRLAYYEADGTLTTLGEPDFLCEADISSAIEALHKRADEKRLREMPPSFSVRERLEREAVQWCAQGGVSSTPFNIITALMALYPDGLPNTNQEPAP